MIPGLFCSPSTYLLPCQVFCSDLSSVRETERQIQVPLSLSRLTFAAKSTQKNNTELNEQLECRPMQHAGTEEDVAWPVALRLGWATCETSVD